MSLWSVLHKRAWSGIALLGEGRLTLLRQARQARQARAWRCSAAAANGLTTAMNGRPTGVESGAEPLRCDADGRGPGFEGIRYERYLQLRYVPLADW